MVYSKFVIFILLIVLTYLTTYHIFRAGNKGYAFTFLTPEQERYSGDIFRAFELAGVPVPDPLRVLFESYKAKQLAVSSSPTIYVIVKLFLFG